MDVHPTLHAWVEAQGKAATGMLSGRVAAGTCATAGHSRGGKLATLLYLRGWQKRWLWVGVDLAPAVTLVGSWGKCAV